MAIEPGTELWDIRQLRKKTGAAGIVVFIDDVEENRIQGYYEYPGKFKERGKAFCQSIFLLMGWQVNRRSGKKRTGVNKAEMVANKVRDLLEMYGCDLHLEGTELQIVTKYIPDEQRTTFVNFADEKKEHKLKTKPTVKQGRNNF